MSDEEQVSGEEMLAQNMAAFEGGEDLPFEEEVVETSDGLEDDVPEGGEELQEEPGDIEEAEEADEDPDSHAFGHMSKEDWEASGKDPDKYLTPGEFDRAGDLRKEDKIDLAKKLAQNESMMREVLSNQQKAMEGAAKREREKVMLELRKEQAEAVDFGDTQKAVDLQKEISNQEIADKPADNNAQFEPGIEEFFNSNQYWYMKDPQATAALDGELQRSRSQGLSFADAIDSAMQRVTQQFPYLVGESQAPIPKKKAAESKLKPRPRVTSEKSRTPSKPAGKKRSFSELDPGIRTIAMRSAKAAGMTEQQYMEAM